MHSVRRFTTLVTFFALLAVAVNSAALTVRAMPRLPDDPGHLLASLRQQTSGSLQVAYHNETGKIRFLAADPAHPIEKSQRLTAAATPEQVSRDFLATYGTLFGLRDQSSDLTVMSTDQVGPNTFVRFQQQYQGVPVLGGELRVQTDRRRDVVSANGEVLPDLAISVQPAVSAESALHTALAALAKTYHLPRSAFQSSTPQLWIFNPALLGGPGLRRPTLVWRMDITTGRGSDIPVRELTLVDAQLNVVALHFNQIADAKERHVCNDDNAIDADNNEKNNCPSDHYVRSEGQGPTGIDDVDLAYDYAGLTYDYYKANFGRDSLDGKGLPLVSLVKYCQPPMGGQSNCPFQNAFWDGQQMTYGDGYASADDVVGHELSHGFTQFTSHLFYYYQSGAINESLSDVFGELIDQTDGAGNDSDAVKWELGEDLPPSIGVVRDMRDPLKFDNPDWTGSSMYYGDTGDHGGVHTNSGVNNKAAYLMTDGGTFRNVTVKGIGAAKTGAIYYTVEVAFLTSGSDYQDLYSYLQAACSSLASNGAYGMTADDCVQVKKAGDATGMPTTPANAPVPEAAVCATGQTSNDLFYDDLENPALGNWVAAPTEGSVNEWYYPAAASPYKDVFSAQYATSGIGNMWGYDQGDDPPADDTTPPPPPADYNIAMTKDVTVPPNAFLHFRHAFEFESDYQADYDGGVVEYSTNGGTTWQDAGPLFAAAGGANGYNTSIDDGSDNPLHGRDVFGNISQGYYSSRADLSSLAGQHVRFRFRIGTDPYVGAYGWFIDDIRVYTCSSTPPTVTLRAANPTVDEGVGKVTVEAVLSGVPSQNVSVSLTASGSATAGSDYLLSGNAIVIPAGSISGKLVIPIIDDADVEENETIILTLATPSGATLGSDAPETITIQDNDKPHGAASKLYIPFMTK